MSEPACAKEVKAFAESVAGGLLSYMNEDEWINLQKLPDKMPQNKQYGSVACETCKINCCITAFEYSCGKTNEYPLGVKVFCWGCNQKVVPAYKLQQIRLASSQDILAIVELLKRVGKLARVRKSLGEAVQYNTPYRRSVDIKPFSTETWEDEVGLFDNQFATEKKKNVRHQLRVSKKSEYNQVNLYVTDQLFNEDNEPKSESTLYQTMFQIRKDEWEFVKFMREYHDFSSSTLVFIDQVGGHGTEAHLDWAQARNILFGLDEQVRASVSQTLLLYTISYSIHHAFLLQKAKEGKPMALWTFIHPDCIDEFTKELQHLAKKSAASMVSQQQVEPQKKRVRKNAQPKAEAEKPKAAEAEELKAAEAEEPKAAEAEEPKAAEAEESKAEAEEAPLGPLQLHADSEHFQEAFKTIQKKHGDEKLFILEQRHGDLVEVEAGWLHAVQNVQPNVKIAWDLIRCSNLRHYVDSWKRHGKLKIKQDYAILEHNLLKIGSFALTKLLLSLR
jgi:hypothetical protein